MTEKQNTVSCAVCNFFDGETRRCTIPDGLMRPIGVLSESMAEATHDCKECEEAVFKLTPMALLSIALQDNKVKVSESKLSAVWNTFERLMEEYGYVQKEEKQ